MQSIATLLLALIAAGVWFQNLGLSQQIVEIVTWVALIICASGIVFAIILAWIEWQELKQ